MARTLASRLTLVTLAAVVAALVVAALLANRLARDSALDSARADLGRLADTVETRADRGDQRGVLLRVRRVLRAVDIQLGTVAATGRVVGPAQVVSAVTTADVEHLQAGDDVSAERRIADDVVLVEARPTSTGAIVLVERRTDALAAGDRSTRSALIAFVVGGLVALLAGVLLARALARPLRRTAAAAHALAAGDREVEVPVEGPREVADVAESVNTLASALTRSEAQQRAFLMSVSHDLRTPLTAIRGFAESMADGAVDDVRGVGSTLTDEARRLERLIDDLLDLARLQADRFRVELVDVRLGDVLVPAADVWAERCRQAGVVFRSEPGQDAVVSTDPGRLRQVVDGLLENALRVAPVGSPLVLAWRTSAEHAELQVRDAGPGLTPEDVRDAFRPGVLYERYRGVRPSGTGLGLSIAAGLVERMGGTIAAGRADEGGAAFTVRLPRPAGVG
jgi:two-component system sensor histidine kinase BaeS